MGLPHWFRIIGLRPAGLFTEEVSLGSSQEVHIRVFEERAQFLIRQKPIVSSSSP